MLSHRKLTILVAAPDGRRQASVGWTPDPGIAPVVDVVLPPGRTLVGVVVNGWTDRPVPGAAVWTRRGHDWEQEIVSDQGGRFTLERVPGDAGDDLEIMAYGAGLAPDTDGWGADVTPQDGRLRLVVFPTMTLTGRAIDAAGEPVAGASVRVTTPRDSLPLLPQPLTVNTGADGAFTVGGVPPVEDVVLLAEAAGHGIGWTRDEIPAVPDARHAVADIVLPSRFVLDVPVVDEDGNAVESATLWVRWRVRTRGMGAAFRDVVAGRFDPVDVPRGSCSIEIAGPGLVPDVLRLSAHT